jgi:succinate-semialdehyde dehydrogenase/glutarate-semialdehyde dehydrogenase
MPHQAINPATGAVLKTYPGHSAAEVHQRVTQAHEAYQRWRQQSFAVRAQVLRALAATLKRRSAELSKLAAQEMGKPVAQGRSEIEKCTAVCEYYAQEGARFLAPELIATDAAKSYVAFEPLGVVLAIMPWNFPYWQVFRFLAPALMAGNGALLKHASNVPGCALAIEAVCREAGVPEGLFATLLMDTKDVAALIAHPLIKAVTLTGSTPAGQAVASAAGAALKKTVLELGGSDPYLILEDAHLPQAAQACAASRLVNGGQSCIAAKRFIVIESVRGPFEGLLVEQMRQRVVGDPLLEGTAVGPLARRDLRDELHRQVERSVALGARVLLGGALPEGPGAFYPPTVLADVKKGMPAYDEETFGPVAAVISVRDEAEAIRVANDTPFGLGAAVFTRDTARGERVAAQVESGSCFINALVRSDPRLPFGGIKASGYGRELSAFGIREFVNIKTMYVARGGA